MKDCEECGKKLGIFEGYQHPTLGKKHLLCSPCFDQVSESVEKWKEFVLSSSFNINNLEKNASKHGLDFKLIQEIVGHTEVNSENQEKVVNFTNSESDTV